jgi:hypothetical protein
MLESNNNNYDDDHSAVVPVMSIGPVSLDTSLPRSAALTQGTQK